MTESPPKRSWSATHAWAKRSFLQTLARLSVKSTQNLNSSVKRTGVQSLTNCQYVWVGAHCKRSWIWRCVKGMQIAGLCDLNPASWNLFLTVCVLTRTPVASWKSLHKVVTFENRWRLAWRTINQSWAWVVERSRHLARICKTFLVIWNRFHNLETTFCDTPRTWATCLCERPASNIPISLFISSSLRRRLTYRLARVC
jgi:hypothetical protein